VIDLNYSGLRNSSPAVANSPFGSANRWVCGSLMLAQISPYGETLHIPGTLCDMPHKNEEEIENV